MRIGKNVRNFNERIAIENVAKLGTLITQSELKALLFVLETIDQVHTQYYMLCVNSICSFVRFRWM